MPSYLIFNTKGGCGKSLIAREVIAGPKASDFVIVEIDPLNKSQLSYSSSFKAVIEIGKDNIEEVLIALNEHDNVVIDVGVDSLSDTVERLVDYQVFEDIHCLVIPLTPGRTDEENALSTYKTIAPLCLKTVFVFNRYDKTMSLEEQFPVFFRNVAKIIPDFNINDHGTLPESGLFPDAQNDRVLVAEMAQQATYKVDALAAKEAGDMNKFRALMQKELHRRAAALLLEKDILPLHEKIVA